MVEHYFFQSTPQLGLGFLNLVLRRHSLLGVISVSLSSPCLPMSSSPPSPSRFQIPRDALKTLSIRTGTPLPSLIFSFAILHELSAVVPLVGIFYGARAMGVGEIVVNSVMQDATRTQGTEDAHPKSSSGLTTWARATMRTWVEEGDRWAERVGHRYGIFGYNKRPKGSTESNGNEGDREDDQRMKVGGRIAGDVANAVVAYGVTKVSSLLTITIDFLKPIYYLGFTPCAHCSLRILFACFLSWFC